MVRSFKSQPQHFKEAQHEKVQNNSILDFLQKFMLFVHLQAWKLFPTFKIAFFPCQLFLVHQVVTSASSLEMHLFLIK